METHALRLLLAAFRVRPLGPSVAESHKPTTYW